MRNIRTIVGVSAVGWLALTFALSACGEDDPVVEPEFDAIDTGSFRLHIQRSPWQMTIQDSEGNPVLVEHSATGPDPTGALGFFLGPPPAGCGEQPSLPPIEAGQPDTPPERDTGWYHATSLVESNYDGETWVGTVATTDPTRTLEVRAVAESDGVIAFTVTPSITEGVQAMGVGFVAEAEELFFGFGERSNSVDQSGWAIENYVTDGPYQSSEYTVMYQVNPDCGLRDRPDATYFPIPWLLSSRGYGVLLDNDELSYHRVGSESADAWSMEVESTEMRFRVFAGPTPAEVLTRLTTSLGTQPRDYAPWFFGPWLQPDSVARVEEMLATDTPTSSTFVSTHYLPSGRHVGREDAESERVEVLNDLGVTVHSYVNPMVSVEFESAFYDAEDMDALVKNGDGDVYIYNYFTTHNTEVGQYDFSAANGVAAYTEITDQAISHGHEGWMEDFGEFTPLDAVSADGVTGTEFHNRYPRDYHCGVAAATSDTGVPLARFARSGWTGSAACSPVVWGGDPTTSWEFDGIESSIYQALSMGTSGVGIWGSDIGGFFSLFDYELTNELMDRWIAFGAFSAVMRTEKGGIRIPETIPRAMVWDEEHMMVWRRYCKLRTQLFPYIQAAAEQYYATGMPVMRHHVLTYSADPAAIARDDQYMFGPDLLVAPIHTEGADERELYLPEGIWVEWWQTVSYVEDDGSFALAEAELHEGSASVTVSAAIDEIPLFVQAGAVIPMLSPDVYTLAEHGDDPSIVHLSDRDDQLHLLAFPRGDSSGQFFESSSYTSAEGDGSWTLQLQDARERTIYLQATLDTLEQPFEACSVTLDDVAVPAADWSYDADSGVLNVEYDCESGELVVTGC